MAVFLCNSICSQTDWFIIFIYLFIHSSIPQTKHYKYSLTIPCYFFLFFLDDIMSLQMTSNYAEVFYILAFCFDSKRIMTCRQCGLFCIDSWCKWLHFTWAALHLIQTQSFVYISERATHTHTHAARWFKKKNLAKVLIFVEQVWHQSDSHHRQVGLQQTQHLSTSSNTSPNSRSDRPIFYWVYITLLTVHSDWRWTLLRDKSIAISQHIYQNID